MKLNKKASEILAKRIKRINERAIRSEKRRAAAEERKQKNEAKLNKIKASIGDSKLAQKVLKLVKMNVTPQDISAMADQLKKEPENEQEKQSMAQNMDSSRNEQRID